MKYYFLFFTYNLMLIQYLTANIALAGQGSTAKNLLFVIIILSISIFIITARNPNKIRVPISLGLLTTFFVYLLLKLVIDIHNISKIKEMFIGTTGGTLLFFLLGSGINIILQQSMQRKLSRNKQFIINVTTIIFQILVLTTLILINVNFTKNLLSTRLVVSGLDGAYQRVGNYLTIVFMIATHAFILLVIRNKLQNVPLRLITQILSTLLFLVTALSALFLAQLLMSNSAFVCITLTTIVALSFQVLMTFRPYFSVQVKTFKSLFFGSTFKFVMTALILAVTTLLIIGSIIIEILGIDASMFRITGYGKGVSNSVTSRLELFNNFPVHHNISPLFGNMNVDKETTGSGTYVHSFLGSMITHLGYVGFLIITSYFLIGIKELFSKIRQSAGENIAQNAYGLFCLVLLMGFVTLASLTTFFTWIPLWFTVGLTFPLFSVEVRS